MKKLLVLFLFMCSCVLSWSQSRQITGRVVSDSARQALPGVNVTLKGTSTTTATNSEGRYTITVPNNNAVLVFSSVGYTAREVNVGAQTSIEVTLTSSAADLDVVVIGYTTVRRKDLTGSVSSTNARELRDIPLNTAAEALTGRLAGVQVTTTEGRPGAEVLIRVRGGGSVNFDNSPLYIVDGIQMENALSILSPQEIQSIDVLKDAASTAIYGARGANGVVVITTKGGRNQKTQVTYNGYAGNRRIANTLDVMNPYDFILYQYQIYNLNTSQQDRDAFVNRYGRYEDLEIYKNMPMEDWQDQLFGRDAFSQSHNVSLTGGSGGTTFNLTLNHATEEGIMLNSGFERTMASFKFDHRVSNRFRVGFSTRYGRQRVDGVGTSNSGTQSSNRLRNAVRFRPFVAPGQEDDIDVFDPTFTNLTNLTSPVLLANQELRFDYRNDIYLNGYASYELVKGLTFKSTAGLTNTDRRTNAFNGPVTSIARQNADLPVVQMGEGESFSLTNSNTLNYKTTLANRHTIDALIGQEIYELRSRNANTTVKWLPADISPEQAFAGIQKATPPIGLIQDAPTTSQGEQRLFSLFTSVNYAYDRKYRATVTVRRDGSSLFSPENRYGIFPAVALAWEVSQEDFMSNVNFIRDVKLRLSYGASGNNRIGADLWKTMYQASSTEGYAFGEAVVPGFFPASLSNSNLKWETTISRNVGLDFALFNRRLNASLDVYQNNVVDLLLNQQVPPTSGWSQQLKNAGKTQNRGIELQLNGDIVRGKNFNWNASFNISHNENKIISLGLDAQGQPQKDYLEASGWITSTYQDFLVQVGGPIGQFYGYVSDGFYTVDDFDYNATTMTYTLKAGIPNTKDVALGNRDPRPGDIRLKKLTNDNNMMITPADRTILGSAQPKFTGGLNQQFRYKNFDASVFLNFSVGNKVYNANKIEFSTQYLYRDNNMLEFMKDRWKWYDDNGTLVTDPESLRKLNANAKYWTPPMGQYFLHSFAIEDGSFLRVNNLTIGYTLPDGIVKRTRAISQFRVYATVNNLVTITGYSGYDPEANTRRNNPLTPGVDYAAYPRSRLFLAGVNVTF
jgi:TonB-linked SusC/RagA family outer membrane protein